MDRVERFAAERLSLGPFHELCGAQRAYWPSSVMVSTSKGVLSRRSEPDR